jgi:hypothetical protein
LNHFDEKAIATLFHEMIVYEAQIEEHRKKLAEAGDFNLIDAFSMLDQKNLGWLATL